MKLLFDENLSPRLVELLAAEFPGTTHVERLAMRGVADALVWAYARDHDFQNRMGDLEAFSRDVEQSLLVLEIQERPI